MKEWFIGMGIFVAVSSLAKFFPKKKVIGFVKPKTYVLGQRVSAWLNTISPSKRSAERIEEGIIVTISMAISESIGGFVDGLLADNTTRKKQQQK